MYTAYVTVTDAFFHGLQSPTLRHELSNYIRVFPDHRSARFFIDSLHNPPTDLRIVALKLPYIHGEASTPFLFKDEPCCCLIGTDPSQPQYAV